MHQRHVFTTLQAYKSAIPSITSGEPWVVPKEKRCTVQDLGTITSLCTFDELVDRLYATLQRLWLLEKEDIYGSGVHRKISLIDATPLSTRTMVTDLNWMACRDLLLLNEKYTLELQLWVSPKDWNWQKALEEMKAEDKKKQQKCNCVVQ